MSDTLAYPFSDPFYSLACDIGEEWAENEYDPPRRRGTAPVPKDHTNSTGLVAFMDALLDRRAMSIVNERCAEKFKEDEA